MFEIGLIIAFLLIIALWYIHEFVIVYDTRTFDIVMQFSESRYLPFEVLVYHDSLPDGVESFRFEKFKEAKRFAKSHRRVSQGVHAAEQRHLDAETKRFKIGPQGVEEDGI